MAEKVMKMDHKEEISANISTLMQIVGNVKQEIKDESNLHSLYKLPDSLSIRQDQSNSCYGIWTKKNIPCGMKFGPYKEVPVNCIELQNSGCCSQQIKTEGSDIAFVEATYTQTNWLKYVNHASVKEKQNLMVLHYQGEIYFLSCKAIPLNTELLVCFENSTEEPASGNKAQTNHLTSDMLPKMSVFHPSNKAPNPQPILNGIDNKQDQDVDSEDDLENDCNIVQCKCNVCNKGFDTSYQLDIHQRFHSNKRCFICDICCYKFKTNHNLQIHKIKHSDRQLFSCSECSKQYKHKSSLQRHERLHTGERPHECDVCSKKFMLHSRVQEHKLTHMTPKERLCHMKLKKNEKLSFISKKHDSNNKMPNNYQRSDKVHECETCHKSFRQFMYLKVHERIHTGEKPYKCDVCDKAFRSKGNCRLHKRIHTKDKRFKCDICNKRFIWCADLQKHKRIHTGEKPYECNVCRKKFSQLATLNTHKRLHTGVKPYECNVCHKKFTDSSNLRAHRIRKHTKYRGGCFRNKADINGTSGVKVCSHNSYNEKLTSVHNEECFESDEEFSQLSRLHNCTLCHIEERQHNDKISSLQSHNRISEEEKLYKCDTCKKQFFRLSTLRAHKRLHTGKSYCKCGICYE